VLAVVHKDSRGQTLPGGDIRRHFARLIPATATALLFF